MATLRELIGSDDKLIPSKHEMEIVHAISSEQKMFTFYKNNDLVNKIKKVVPITELSNKCTQRMMALQQTTNVTENSDNQNPLTSRDIFFLLLLEWFKTDFFSWFDCGYCLNCSKPMKSFGRAQPIHEEAIWNASTIEVYKCGGCAATERFPRYNHPMKLLETRKGRCGEWRNCFSAICVAFNYTIRLVIDFQDHVWNEIYLDSQKRWIHFDCCENAFDTPLMYEVGWGKKLVYCIATSEYDCQDVTVRYTRDYQSVLLRRRGRSRADWLNRYLLHVSSKLQRDCDITLKKQLLGRRLAEIASLIIIPGEEKALKDSEKQGRSSGSISWRAARGECSTKESYKFIVKFDKETADGSHRFAYQPVSNIYTIDRLTKLTGWSSATFHHANIDKKVEKDWKMTYLCRSENSDCKEIGVLVYKFDTRFDWTHLMVKIDSKFYDSGQISAKLTSEPENGAIDLDLNEINILKRSDFAEDVDYLLLTITLSGGSGDIGWQQAQLFRHSTVYPENNYPLDIVFTK